MKAYFLLVLTILGICTSCGYANPDALFFLEMERENHIYVTNFYGGNSISLLREECSIYKITNNGKILLGQLYDWDEDKDIEACINHPYVLIGDINNDGEHEFFLTQYYTMADIFCSVVDNDGNDITDIIFDLTELNIFPDNVQKLLPSPFFDVKKQQLTFSLKSGPVRWRWVFARDGNKFNVYERISTLVPQYPEELYGIDALEKHERFVDSKVTETWYSTYLCTNEAIGITITNLQIFDDAQSNLTHIATIPKGTNVKIIDIIDNNFDSTCTSQFWLKIFDGINYGWTNEIWHINFSDLSCNCYY